MLRSLPVLGNLKTTRGFNRRTLATVAFSELKTKSSTNPQSARSIFDKHGLVVFEPTNALNTQALKTEALDTLQSYIKIAEKKGFGLKKENGFRELVVKDLGRYDMNLDHVRSDNENQNFVSIVHNHIVSNTDPLLRDLFGDYILNAKGLVISYPGTTAQDWHVDSSHLFVQKPGQPKLTIPCHLVTVFVPLYEARPEVGPTEFLLGSPPLTNILKNSVVEDQYPSAEVLNKSFYPHTNRGTLECKPGDIVVMDGRTLHRGLGNTSQEVRPLFYFSFCPPWYREWPRSHDDTRSLFNP